MAADPHAPRLLVFAEAGFPPQNAEAYVALKLVLAMIRAGWDADMICLDTRRADVPQIAPESLWEPLAARLHLVGVRFGSKAANIWRKMRIAAATGQLVPDVGWALAALDTARRLLRRKAYDFILSRSEPMAGHQPALVLARETRLPWVANWSDPCPLQSYPPPYGAGPGGPMRLRVRRYLAAVGNGATWHTFPCERLRRYFFSYLPADIRARSSVIPHIVLDRPAGEREARRDRFRIRCAGDLTKRSPDTFLEGVKRFLDAEPGAAGVLSVSFRGKAVEQVQQGATRLGLDKIVETAPPIPYNESLAYVAGADVLLVIEADCDEGIFLPSKLVDYIQAGRPVLAVSPREGTLADILGAHGGGIAVDRRSPEAIAGALRRLYEAWRAGRLDEDFASARLLPLFSEQTVLKAYRDLFDLLKGRNDAPSDHGARER